MPEFIEQPGQGAAVKDRTKLRPPRRYKVLLLNDNYTTMEFVVEVLQGIFHKPHDEAVRIMMNVHKNGSGLAGVYVRAVAEAKVAAVHDLAQESGYPLRCEMEQE
ncbi:MAG: ATP-dependent Clp protease adapter ClpS [Candidatus Hydrogenedens sp.]|nr:ATP-dependent Clp protease adapter ClpS [Candidatus Hydrogenedens sp.]